MYAWARDKLEKRLRATILPLLIRSLYTQLMTPHPISTLRHRASLVLVRQPRKEPFVRAVFVIDLERHEKASAQSD